MSSVDGQKKKEDAEDEKLAKEAKINENPLRSNVRSNPFLSIIRTRGRVVHGAPLVIATAERGRAAEKWLMSGQPDLSSFLPHSRLATGNQVGNIISFRPASCTSFVHVFQQFSSRSSRIFAPLTGSSPLIYDPQTALISVRQILQRRHRS